MSFLASPGKRVWGESASDPLIGPLSAKKNSWSNASHFGDSPEKFVSRLLCLLGNEKNIFGKQKYPVRGSSGKLKGIPFDEIASLCRSLTKSLAGRRTVQYRSKNEASSALKKLIECSIRLCQYVLHTHDMPSPSNQRSAAYKFLIAVLSRPEFDFFHVHNRTESGLNDLGARYMHMALNCLKVAVRKSYNGFLEDCEFAARCFARLMFRLPIIAGHVVDCFPNAFGSHLKRIYRASTYSHFIHKVVSREAPSKGEAMGKQEDIQFQKFIDNNPELFAWDFSRFADSTRLIFETASNIERDSTVPCANSWNSKIKDCDTFSLTFADEYVCHVSSVAKGVIIWHRLPLYTFIIDNVCLYFRSQLNFAKCETTYMGLPGSSKHDGFEHLGFLGDKSSVNVFHYKYSRHFFKSLIHSLAMLSKHDDNVCGTILHTITKNFCTNNPLLLELETDTLKLLFENMSSAILSKFLGSVTMKWALGVMLSSDNISLICHGIYLTAAAMKNASDETRSSIVRWFFYEYFSALYLHWSSMVRGFFHHFLVYNCFKLRRRLLPLLSDHIILNMSPEDERHPMNLEFSTPRIEVIDEFQHLAPDDLAISTKLDAFVHVTLKELNADGRTEVRYCGAGPITKQRRNYIRQSSEEYANVLRAGIRFQENRKPSTKKYSMYAPPSPELNLLAIRGLMHSHHKM